MTPDRVSWPVSRPSLRRCRVAFLGVAVLAELVASTTEAHEWSGFLPERNGVAHDSLDVEIAPQTVTGRSETPDDRLPWRPRAVERAEIDRRGSNNLIDALDGKPGLLKTIDCSVCNTAQIRLLGLNGAYTQILVDGVPAYTGLSMVYGVEQLSLANVERIEVIQGVGSVTHGSNAVAGVINVVTARPRPSPEAGVLVRYGNSNEQDYAGSYSGTHGGVGVQFSFAKNSAPEINPDDDAVNDAAAYDRTVFSGRAVIPVGDRFSMYYGFNSGFEDRFGGTVSSSRFWIGDFQPETTFVDDFGNTVHRPLIYQEYVQSRRATYEAGTTAWLNEHLVSETRLHIAEHYQQSWYGLYDLEAKQRVVFTESNLTLRTARHEAVAGFAYQYDGFRDNRSLGTHAYHVPAVYVQDIWAPAVGWRLLAGVRGDRHNVHGLLVSPRAGVLHDGFPTLALRVNAGGGFRTFNLFSENHAATTSAVYRLDPVDDLDAERSWSVVAGAEWRPLSTSPSLWDATFDLSAYQTWVTGYLQAQYLPEFTEDGRQRVRYVNLDDATVARGVQLTGSLASPFGFFADAGLNILDNYGTRNGRKARLYETPDHTASISLTQTFPSPGLTLLADANRVGGKRLREVRFGPPPEDGPDGNLAQPERRTAPYTIYNAGLEQRFGAFTLFFSARNLGDFYQARREPVLYARGYHVITNSVFAPLKGRSFHLGVRGRFGGRH